MGRKSTHFLNKQKNQTNYNDIEKEPGRIFPKNDYISPMIGSNIKHYQIEPKSYTNNVSVNPHLKITPMGKSDNSEFYIKKGMEFKRQEIKSIDGHFTNKSQTKYTTLGMEHKLDDFTKLSMQHTLAKPKGGIDYNLTGIGLTKKLDDSSNVKFQAYQARSRNMKQNLETEISASFNKECNIFFIDKITYDNEILNHPKLFDSFIKKHGVEYISKLVDLGAGFITEDEKCSLSELCFSDNALESLELLMGCNDNIDVIDL